MKKLGLLFAVVLLINSCKTDIDVLADWKETAVVYGLLNQNDTAHYIRVNKAFLGEGNAIEMAGVFDSINYPAYLKVKIERWKNGNMVSSDTLERDLSVVKESGLFSSPGQVLFKLKKTIYDDSEYRLHVLNSKSNYYLTSKTSLVGDFVIDKPTPSTPSVSFTNPTVPYKVIWKTSDNGRLYDFVLRFNYIEEDLVTTIQTPKYVDIYFGTQKSRTLNGGETMEVSFLGEFFYKSLTNYIKPDAAVKRIIGKLDFIFSVAADDFSTYMEVNQPSTGIVQEKPEYTNVENGFGIFSARYNKSVANIALNDPSKDSLRYGIFTKNLGFE